MFAFFEYMVKTAIFEEILLTRGPVGILSLLFFFHSVMSPLKETPTKILMVSSVLFGVICETSLGGRTTSWFISYKQLFETSQCLLSFASSMGRSTLIPGSNPVSTKSFPTFLASTQIFTLACTRFGNYIPLAHYFCVF
jgi:hypothetical protein